MSRIGAKPLSLTPTQKVELQGGILTVTGPKGVLTVSLPSVIKFNNDNGVVTFTRTSDTPQTKALHGLVRSLFKNALIGVSDGFTRKLELVGTGYRVRADGKNLELTVGYSHPVKFAAVPGIDLAVEGNNVIYIKGIDKHLVGQVAANIRAIRAPEPYKGKGIRYSDEVVRRKAGKAAKGGEK